MRAEIQSRPSGADRIGGANCRLMMQYGESTSVLRGLRQARDMTIGIVRRKARTGCLPRGSQSRPELVGEQRVSPVRAIPQSTLCRTSLVTPGAEGGSLGRAQVWPASVTVGFRRQHTSG